MLHIISCTWIYNSYDILHKTDWSFVVQYRERIIILGQYIDEDFSSDLMEMILYLDTQDTKDPILFFINSPGGDVSYLYIIWVLKTCFTFWFNIFCRIYFSCCWELESFRRLDQPFPSMTQCRACKVLWAPNVLALHLIRQVFFLQLETRYVPTPSCFSHRNIVALLTMQRWMQSTPQLVYEHE